jgi:hypothetical protein
MEPRHGRLLAQSRRNVTCTCGRDIDEGNAFSARAVPVNANFCAAQRAAAIEENSEAGAIATTRF